MTLMAWNDSLNLDIDVIDGHHRRLFALVNSAHELMATDCTQENMLNLLSELVDYATYHFSTEEYWMNLYCYPQLQAHLKEHEEFCIKVVEQELLLESGDLSAFRDLIEFLSIWLVEHIQKADGDYGVFARSIRATHDIGQLPQQLKPL